MYTARYGHTDNCIPGILELDATTDDEAIAEARKIAKAGYKGESWVAVELSTGVNFVARA